MNTPIEITPQQLLAIQKQELTIEQHKIMDDRRRTPFISVEEFERKWAINQPKSDI